MRRDTLTAEDLALLAGDPLRPFRKKTKMQRKTIWIAVVLGLLGWVLAFASVANAQTHVPSGTVQGLIVTFDADFVAIDPQQDMTGIELREGVVLLGGPPRYAASVDGVSPIRYMMPSGTYAVTVHGFPDDPAVPERNIVQLSVVVAPPTRAEQIADAFMGFFRGRNQAAKALADIALLNPTDQEIIDAFAR